MQLYKHQQYGVDTIVPLLEQYGLAYLQGAERVGKTHTVLSICKELELNDVLIVTAKKAIPSILSDFESGDYDFHLDVTNYESLHKHKRKHKIVIFDEMHKVSAYRKGKTIKGVYAYLKKYRPGYRLGMSATPSSEHLGQWWQQMNILGMPWPRSCISFYDAHRRYGKPNMVYTPYGQKETYKAWHQDFYRLFSKIVIKISREDAEFDIPESTLVQEHIDMTPELKQLYSDLSTKAIVGDVFLDTETKRFAKLRQVVGGFLIQDDESVISIAQNKLDRVLHLSQSREKVAVYCYYKAEIAMLVETLQACTDPNDFKTNDTKYLVMQIQSGALGIDLSFCDIHILYSFSYSGTVFTQSINRMLNKRRDTPAYVHVFTTNESIEAEAFKMVSQKRNYNIDSFRSSYD